MSTQQDQDPDPIFNVSHFTLADALLTIHETDTMSTFIPPDRIQEIKKDGKKDVKKWYEQMPLHGKISVDWRQKLGDELVHKFLLVDRAKHTKYTLTGFPPGYALYVHKAGTRMKWDDIRHDAYLFGGGHKFRSPREALFHFAWLMSGMQPNRCRCVYDTPDRKYRRRQGNINKSFDAEWKALQDERAKRRYDDFKRHRETDEAYHPPPPTVNVFNEAMFLRKANNYYDTTL